MKTCPFFHDHVDGDPSYDDCMVAYEDAKARMAPKPRSDMLTHGTRYHVVYREQGKRLPREMVVDFTTSTQSYAFFSGRPDFGTVQVAWVDVISVAPVEQTARIVQARPVRQS